MKGPVFVYGNICNRCSTSTALFAQQFEDLERHFHHHIQLLRPVCTENQPGFARLNIFFVLLRPGDQELPCRAVHPAEFHYVITKRLRPTILGSSECRPGVSNTRPSGSMWPARVFCAICDALGNFQIINIYLILFVHQRLKVSWRVNKFLLKKRGDG